MGARKTGGVARGENPGVNILNFPNFLIQKHEESEHDYRFHCTYLPEPEVCPHCGVVGAAFYKHGPREQSIWDLPIRAKRVQILLYRQRYKCRECEQTFYERIPEIDESRKMTVRLREYIERESLEKTFTAVAHDVGIVEGTVRQVFNAYIGELEAARTVTTPEQLGIDEIHLLGKLRCILTNVEQRSIVDILKERDQKTVETYLTKLKDRDRVKLVAIDMWQPYKMAANRLLPDAAVVIDKFHVLRTSNYCLDMFRKSLREGMKPGERRQLMRERHLLQKRAHNLTEKEKWGLEVWLNQIPDLKAAYDAKEAFYAIYDAPDRDQAERLYQSWRGGLSPSLRDTYKPLLTALGNWEGEIFAYFDHRITNAYTECLNGLVKMANRTGRGYSFDVMRAKMIYSRSLQKNLRPKYGEGWREPVEEKQQQEFGMDLTMYPYLTDGIDIPLLVVKWFGPPPTEFVQQAGRFHRLPESPDDTDSTTFYE